MNGAASRRALLLEQTALTGIDFVRVVDPGDQRRLDVYLLVDLDPPLDVAPEQVAIVATDPAARIPTVEVTDVDARRDGDRALLAVTVAEPGDFARYRLAIDHPRVDRFLGAADFSFKQGCESPFDCQLPPLACPPEDAEEVVIDYLARDFTSMRAALLDFAARRHPDWREAIEADGAVMFLELLAALTDEFSYTQDRYARESHFATATQRRSLRRHARLVDYDPDDGVAATTELLVDVLESVGGAHIPAGARAWTPAVAGERPIPFEVGASLFDRRAPRRFWVHEAWNAVPLYLADAAAPRLPIGATELYLDGHVPLAGHSPDATPPEELWRGRRVVIDAPADEGDGGPRRIAVTVTDLEFTSDPLTSAEITRVAWDEDEALTCDLPIAGTTVRANLVPAVAGETVEETFVIGRDTPGAPDAARAVERQGPLNEITGRRTPAFLYTLRATEARGLGWIPDPERALAPGAGPAVQPDVEIEELDPATGESLANPRWWRWLPSLLDAEPDDRAFAIDDGAWRRIIAFRRRGEEIVHEDYAGQAGATVRFGDSEFGRIPDDGTLFRARYRTGPGALANLGPDAVTGLTDPEGDPSELTAWVGAVTNPFAITSGRDPESNEVVRQLAPEAFRAITFRAVRPEDYRAIAERFPWVQRAGARTRWTGSWLSTFVTADPRGAASLSTERRRALADRMACVRQVGHDVAALDPAYVDLDLAIVLCVAPSAFPGKVLERVTRALAGPRRPGEPPAFFDPDHFTFGTPLRRADLEAAIHTIPGVLGVDHIDLRARGLTDWRPFDELVLEVGAHQVLRLENDPRRPGRGSLRVTAKGNG